MILLRAFFLVLLFSCPTSGSPINQDHFEIPDDFMSSLNDGVNQNPSVISPTDPRYAAFLDYAQRLNSTLNFNLNPCTDFYDYVCSPNEFAIQDLQDSATQALLNALKKPAEFDATRKLKKYFDACLREPEPKIVIEDQYQIVAKAAGVPFPALSGRPDAVDKPPKPTLTNLLLEGRIVKVGIDEFPKKVDGYLYTVSLSGPLLLEADSTYLVLNEWPTYRPTLKEELTSFLKKLAARLQLPVDDSVLSKDVDDVLDVEKYLAENAANDKFVRLQTPVQRALYALKDMIPVVNSASATTRTNAIFKQLDPTPNPERRCLENVASIPRVNFLTDRLYIDSRIPNKADREAKFSAVEKMIKRIIEGFRIEINKLNWPESFKKGVNTKLNNMQINVGYPRRVDSDDFLNNFYMAWNVTDGHEAESLSLFTQTQNILMLSRTERDRTDFTGSVNEVNAANNPYRNSINVYDAILYPPNFRSDYPAAVNHGAIGFALAHEIVHSFDNSGVEYDDQGYVNPWLDPESKALFDSMEQCVIDQYNTFKTSQGWPIDGKFTAGENIADNGGIRATFNAYKKHQSLFGEDPRLPIDRVSSFTNDQLFFIGMTKPCPAKESKFETYDDFVQSMNEAVNPSPPIIAPTDPRFPLFMGYAWGLNATLNFTLNPCTNFYEYVCSPGEDPRESLLRNSNDAIFKGLKKPAKFDAMKKLKQYFDDCVAGSSSKEMVEETYNITKETLGMDFPALSGDAAKIEKPSRAQISKIANFGGLISIHTDEFLRKNSFVKTLGISSESVLEEGYFYSYRYEWDEFRPTLKAQLSVFLKNLSKYLSLPMDASIIERDIEDILNVEKYVADYAGVDRILRKSTAPQNLKLTLTIGEASQRFPFLDFQSAVLDYLEEETDELKARFSSEKAEIIIGLPDRFANLSSYVLSNAITGRTLYNYMFLQRMYPLKDMLLQPNSILIKQKESRDSVAVNVSPPEHTCFSSLIQTPILYPLLDRLYIDERIPNKEERRTKFSYVTQMVKEIVEGFRLEISKMKWPETFKKHVDIKLNNMQINVGYPTKVDSDQFLNDYYSEWNLTDANPIQSLNIFDEIQSAKEMMTSERDRTDFSRRIASEFNAFNNAGRNSINILDGILYPYLYHVQYPAAVNYGTLGSVIAHEIVHSFDITGVEFDEQGYLNSWLDPESKRLFDSMAECVINQYNAMTTPQGWPIDGKLSAGENIADNGGIHGAFNAYKAHQAQVGEDPRLPIDRVSGLTNDQLFFIGFGKFFCNAGIQTKLELYSDVHAPNKNRVIGALQNSNEFKKAFNCKPTDFPAKKSEFETYDDFVQSMNEAVNPSPPIIAPTDPRFPLFMGYAWGLNATLNFTLNPCTDFYEYVCSPGENPGASLTRLSNDLIFQGLKKPAKFEAMKKLKQYIDDCVAGSSSKEIVEETYKSAKETLGMDFPALSGDAARIEKPSREQISKIANFGGLISIYTEEFPRKNNFAYTVGISSASVLEKGLLYSYRYEWNEIRPFLKVQLIDILKNLSKYLSMPMDAGIIEQDIEDILKVEKYLADYGSNDPILQKKTAVQDIKLTLTIGEASQRFPFLDFQSAILNYLNEEPDEVKARFSSEKAEIVITLPDRLANLSSYLLSNALTGRTLYNYMFLKRMYPLKETLLPSNSVLIKQKKLRDGVAINLSPAEEICFNRLISDESSILNHLLDRIYIDERIPNKEDRRTKFSYVTQMVKEIVEGFRINVGYPTKVDSDQFLNDFYSEWNLTDGNSIESLKVFQKIQRAKTLMKLERDRTEFAGRASEFNAYNRPDRNSINILDGILYPHIYHVQYPAAVNYGTLGSVIAHEIVHSFDIRGVEFDEQGYLNSWLDPESKRLFDSMAECVINQYNAMTTPQGWRIDGNFSAGENIADNGGIHGAFNAYKAHQAQVGEDPRLPIDRVSGLTNDQLFFIGFAKFSCKPGIQNKFELYSEYAPSKNRVIGVLQNSNEFKKAFNCKPTDLYAQKHCDVYTVSGNDC
uniref:Peptidase_M13 domain-containing protein n=1 Tax=Bursaphelenchus xylophilus TaxID=6326 RepID=A0A1I7S2U6_BURXY